MAVGDCFRQYPHFSYEKIKQMIAHNCILLKVLSAFLQFAACDPIAAIHETEEDKIVLIFGGNENWRRWKTLEQKDRDDILVANSYDEKYKEEYYQHIKNRDPDSAMRVDNTIYFFFGE